MTITGCEQHADTACCMLNKVNTGKLLVDVAPHIPNSLIKCGNSFLTLARKTEDSDQIQILISFQSQCTSLHLCQYQALTLTFLPSPPLVSDSQIKHFPAVVHWRKILPEICLSRAFCGSVSGTNCEVQSSSSNLILSVHCWHYWVIDAAKF